MIGCLYISNFPAWALQAQHPSWRAIAVYHQGRIVARSRLLGQRGLQTGEPLERARALFPDARFFEQDHPFERAVWEGVVHRVNEITPFLLIVEHGRLLFRPDAVEEARALADTLAVSIGLGPNRSIASLAALRSTPGSVLQIERDSVARFLSNTRVDVLLDMGFEDDLVERLHLFGLTSLVSLRPLSQKHLRAQFSSAGERLYNLLNPDERSAHVPLYIPPATITETFDMDGASLEWLPLNHLIEQLARRAVRRLGTKRLCRTVTVQLRHQSGFVFIKQRVLRKPAANVGEVVRAASALLDLLMCEAAGGTELILTLGGFRNPHHRQASLFVERPPLSSAISNLEERFPGLAKRVTVVNPEAPFPEDAVRYSSFDV
jgi:hypothetical protein